VNDFDLGVKNNLLWYLMPAPLSNGQNPPVTGRSNQATENSDLYRKKEKFVE